MTKIVLFTLPETAGGRQWTRLLAISLAGDPQKKDFAIGHCATMQRVDHSLQFALEAGQ